MRKVIDRMHLEYIRRASGITAFQNSNILSQAEKDQIYRFCVHSTHE